MDSMQEEEVRRQEAIRREAEQKSAAEKEAASRKEALENEANLKDQSQNEEALRVEAIEKETVEKEELQKQEATMQEALQKEEQLKEEARQQELRQKEESLRKEVKQIEALREQSFIQEEALRQSMFSDLESSQPPTIAEHGPDTDLMEGPAHDNLGPATSNQGIFSELSANESIGVDSQEELFEIGSISAEKLRQENIGFTEASASGMFADLAPETPEVQSPENQVVEMQIIEQQSVAQAAFALQMEEHGHPEAFDSLKSIEDTRLNANEQARMDCAKVREQTLNNMEMTPEEKVASLDQADMQMREQVISNGEAALSMGKAVIEQYSMELQGQYEMEQSQIVQQHTPEVEDTLSHEAPEMYELS